MCYMRACMQALIDMVGEATSNGQQNHAPAASALYTLGSMCKYVDCSRQLGTASFAALLATCATSDNQELRQRAERVQVSMPRQSSASCLDVTRYGSKTLLQPAL